MLSLLPLQVDIYNATDNKLIATGRHTKAL
jgi:hypothetical protein